MQKIKRTANRHKRENAEIHYITNALQNGDLKEVGGETGIRTLGRLAPSTVFETAPFDHSGTSPQRLSLDIPNPADKSIF